MTEQDGRIASVCFDSDKNETKTAELKVKPKGKQTVWLLFKSRGMDVFSFSFQAKSECDLHIREERAADKGKDFG